MHNRTLRHYVTDVNPKRRDMHACVGAFGVGAHVRICGHASARVCAWVHEYIGVGE